MKCPTCQGTGEVPDPATECTAAISPNGTERITCYGVQHDGHHAALVEMPACPACGGYDEHVARCGLIGIETEGAKWMVWVEPAIGEAAVVGFVTDARPDNIILVGEVARG